MGLIHYVWGEHGEKLGTGGKPWYSSLGLRDGKRVVVLLIILFYAAGLFTALSLRRAVLVQIAPIRATLYRQNQDGTIYNRFRLKIANRSNQQQTVVLGIDGLPGAKFASFENAVVVSRGQALEREFEIAVPPSAGVAAGVNHFRLTSRVGNEHDSWRKPLLHRSKIRSENHTGGVRA